MSQIPIGWLINNEWLETSPFAKGWLMIVGVPNRPLYFYQKDIVASNSYHRSEAKFLPESTQMGYESTLQIKSDRAFSHDPNPVQKSPKILSQPQRLDAHLRRPAGRAGHPFTPGKQYLA